MSDMQNSVTCSDKNNDVDYSQLTDEHVKEKTSPILQ